MAMCIITTLSHPGRPTSTAMGCSTSQWLSLPSLKRNSSEVRLSNILFLFFFIYHSIVAVDAHLWETASTISNALLGELMGLAGVNDVYDIRKASDPTDPIVAV